VVQRNRCTAIMSESGHNLPKGCASTSPLSVSIAVIRPSWRHLHFVPTPVVSRCSKAAPYSITSSARASNVGGTSRPKAFAVCRLIMNSNLVGRRTGMSGGFFPFRIWPA
jgi:hypothetical protein